MSVYSKVKALRPGRSAFNLSYDKKFDGDMGLLYPILCDECVPGDTWKVGNQIAIRFNPLVAPIMHEINAYVHYFFVPTRLLFKDSDVPEGANISKNEYWESFLTQGKDGKQFNESTVATSIDLPLPTWIPTTTPAMYSLWDYMGFPLVKPDDDNCPLSFGKRAYNLIVNEYYIDANIMDPYDLDSDTVKRRCWEKDYFTSALPWQQKGIQPALPVNVTLSGNGFVQYTSSNSGTGLGNSVTLGGALTDKTATDTSQTETAIYGVGGASSSAHKLYVDGSQITASSATFNVSDLRLAFQIQKWLERNARSGSNRYTEFLKAHFGVSPTDARLQRPEYIGGTKSPVIISEVLQTSGTESDSGTQVTPQGNMAGHGLSADANFVASYHCEEFGYIVGILSVMPRSNYSQGINRQWLRKTRYDFYFSEFSTLSEQAITQNEIYTSTTKADNETIFGYQGRYNEMRSKQSMICGTFRTTEDYWHLGREFASAPLLNQSFLECNPRKDIFAVPSVPGLKITVGNLLKVIRPMPLMAEPGLIDHN